MKKRHYNSKQIRIIKEVQSNTILNDSTELTITHVRKMLGLSKSRDRQRASALIVSLIKKGVLVEIEPPTFTSSRIVRLNNENIKKSEDSNE